MISYEKAKLGKRLMKKVIVEGELEKAAFIGIMYQIPIRTGDAVTLRKSDLDGRIILKASSKYGELYTNRHGNPYRITRQLQCLLNSIDGDSDFIVTRKREYYYMRFFYLPLVSPPISTEMPLIQPAMCHHLMKRHKNARSAPSLLKMSL